MFPERRRASALVYHQVSRVLRLLLQRGHRHVWVVRHLRNYMQGSAAGEPRRPGLACPHLHYHPHCACSVARVHWSSVVTNHTGIVALGRGHRGSAHTTSALGSWCSPSASTWQRMYRRAAGGWYAAPGVGGDRLPRRQ